MILVVWPVKAWYLNKDIKGRRTSHRASGGKQSGRENSKCKGTEARAKKRAQLDRTLRTRESRVRSCGQKWTWSP